MFSYNNYTLYRILYLMKRTLFLFSFQLHPLYLESFGFDRFNDEIILVDSEDQWTHYRFHKQRLTLHLSSYLHYYYELKNEGYTITYIKSFTLIDALKQYKDLYVFKPTNVYEVTWLSFHPSIHYLKDPLFLVDAERWPTFIDIQKSSKLDGIYRTLRQEFNILMENGLPCGGQYSYDGENRKKAPVDVQFVPPLFFPKDAMTKDVIENIESRFASHPGKTDSFQYPVTRKDALASLDHFVTFRLPTFGDYQDAMVDHLPWMSHSLLSSSINIGLLSPKEVIDAVLIAFDKGLAPLASTEGFIRQVLGWREYVRGIYLVRGQSYMHYNALHHHQPLPKFYYDAETNMHCLKMSIEETITNGYNHHIQRLMVLSNYASLASVDPFALNTWFNEMYIDSSEWIVAANVIGMGSYADGGLMSTKPYISSGAYIHKMSTYCDSCTFKVEIKTGEKACPFNILYWDYIDRHQDTFKKNPRMAMMVNVWSKMDTSLKSTIVEEAKSRIKYHG